MNKETRLYHKNRQMAAMVAKESVVDATGAIVGRLASVLAKRLMSGETIYVLNAEKAVISGRPSAIKARYVFKLTVGTRRKGPFFPRVPHRMLKRSVRSMMPYQLPNGRAAYKRLICHIGVPPEFKDRKPEVIEGAVKHVRLSMTLGEVARYLGGRTPEVTT